MLNCAVHGSPALLDRRSLAVRPLISAARHGSVAGGATSLLIALPRPRATRFGASPSQVTAPFLRGARIRYKGKTIRSRRLDELLYLFIVGTSHPSVTKVPYGCWTRKVLKQRMSVWGFSPRRVREYVVSIASIKFPNLYHGRGVRPTRMALFWKAGKVSAYR
jgi:hypothetical protein